MNLLSIDVGINNLSYVIMNITENNKFQIISWKNIDINKSYTDLDYVCSKYLHMTKPDLIECCNINNIEFNEKDTSKIIKEAIKKHLKLKKIKKTNQINYKKTLLNLKKHFDEILNDEITNIVIENQPVVKNPKMKSIQMVLFTYLQLKFPEINVEFINANEKLKYCKKEGLIESIPKTYKDNKKTSINVVTKLISEMTDFIEQFENEKKKDDLSDVILQGLAYQFKMCV
ncbi:putative Holliday junction resolvase [Aureococcus anophagefferens virus]|uniref:Putative Holliday junction resolvase n=1 Tax=Aureococcus anophagefferens virus TaxID=1474867 RepID=A0A076FHG8_9VIRU|nr:putative Holliday junction resolvase [Aureococcus anophagefferens virus]AII17212.1 putative Holliday junction resolvase [Aureococcus anophagefferens virus]UOG94115.1 hypothetical protein MKD35_74 [Aureococcus anophagefferens virus]